MNTLTVAIGGIVERTRWTDPTHAGYQPQIHGLGIGSIIFPTHCKDTQTPLFTYQVPLCPGV